MCGSDGSEGVGDVEVDGNERWGFSFNLLVCGNVFGGNDRLGFSDGLFEGEVICSVER